MGQTLHKKKVTLKKKTGAKGKMVKKTKTTPAVKPLKTGETTQPRKKTTR